MPRPPGAPSGSEALRIPAPFAQASEFAIDRDQSKRSQIAQRQCAQIAPETFCARETDQSWDHLAAALGFSAGLALDPVPVDQSETESGIVHGQPGAAAGLMRVKGLALAEIELFRRQSRDPGAFLVAIHRQAESLGDRQERKSAHGGMEFRISNLAFRLQARRKLYLSGKFAARARIGLN